MNINPKKILIVSYSLPPFGGIGGRRWTKFGLELKNRGYDIKYLTPKRRSDGHKRWEKDYEAIKNDIHHFKSVYPPIIQNFNLTIPQKIAYRFWLNRIKLAEKGNYFDPSCLDKKPLTYAVSKFVDMGYRTVISTGAPFIQLYHLSELRIKKKNFKFIADLRDPWTMQDWSYGFPSLSKNRILKEKERESFVMKSADKVISVLPRMTKDLANYSNPEKFVTIFNGYDEKDIVPPKIDMNQDDAVHFIFAGNFYDHAIHHIQELVYSLKALKIQDPVLYNKMKFNFYGSAPEAFFTITHDEPSIVHHGFVSSTIVSQKIADSDIGVLFLIDGFNYSLSTKFFEYIAQNKPILLFAKHGETSDYVIKNKLGWHFQSLNAFDILNQILKKKKNNNLNLPSTFERDQFSIKTLTNELEIILND